MTPTGTTVMPANLVKGKDLTDVSAFVALCAGNSEVAGLLAARAARSPRPPARHLPAGGLLRLPHAQADAGANGDVGPNLDDAKPPESLVVDRVTNGKGVMPSFKDKLTPAQIQAVAKYVSSVAGK